MEVKNVKGSVTLLAFFMFLLLAFWCINIYRHIASGRWTKKQKITDTIGFVMLAAAFAGMVIPMLK